MKTFKDFRSTPGMESLTGFYDSLFVEFDNYRLDSPRELAVIFDVLNGKFGAYPRYAEWARLFREPLDLSGLLNHPDYAFYQTLLKPKATLLHYFEALPQPDLVDLCSRPANLALSYMMADVEAWHILFARATISLSTQLNLLIWVLHVGHLAGLNYLLDIPEILAYVLNNADKIAHGALSDGRAVLLERLLEIPAVRAAIINDITEFLRHAADSGHLAVIEILFTLPQVLANPDTMVWILSKIIQKDKAVTERLLQMPGILAAAAGVQFYNQKFLVWAVSQGSLSLVESMLALPGFAQSAALLNNEALQEALAYPKIVNRLLRLPNVRRTYYANNFVSKPNVLHSGVVRALWLDLQDIPGFALIQEIADLQTLAKAYIDQNPNWVGLCTREQEKLLASLQHQILSLAFYNPLLTVAQLSTNPQMQKSLIDTSARIDGFIELPLKSLNYFKESSLMPSYKLALTCLKHWSSVRRTQKGSLKKVEHNNSPLAQQNKSESLSEIASKRPLINY